MKKEIILKGTNQSLLSVSFIDVLKQINHSEKVTWKILWLEATGNLIKENILDLENKINNSISGYSINYSELCSLAKEVDQIIEILLIGSSNINTLKRYKDDSEMKKSCDYCIELIDSSYWEISSADENFINSLLENLNGSLVTPL